MIQVIVFFVTFGILVSKGVGVVGAFLWALVLSFIFSLIILTIIAAASGMLRTSPYNRLVSGIGILIVVVLTLYIFGVIISKIYSYGSDGEKLFSKDVDIENKLADETTRLWSAGAYQQAVQPATELLKLCEIRGGPDHPDVATALNNLASLYQSTGDYKLAAPLLIRALSIYEKELGSDHPDVATAINNLAEYYQTTGDYEKAKPLYVRALGIYENVLGPEHPEVATSLNNLAAHYQTIGDYEQAKPLLERALNISEKAFGPDHPDVAQILNNLALLYKTIGDFRQAKLLYERALGIKERVLGPYHPKVAISLSNLAGFYRTIGDHGRVKQLLDQALNITVNVLGSDHPDVAKCLSNLAGHYADIGAHMDAKPLCERALNITMKSLENIFTISGTRQKMMAVRKNEMFYDQMLTVVRKAGQTDSELVGAFEGLYQFKGIVLEALAREREAVAAWGDSETVRQYDELAGYKSRLSNLYSAGLKDRTPEQYKQVIKSMEEKIEAAEQGLAKSSAIIRRRLVSRKLKLADIQKQIPPKSLVIDYYHFRDVDENKFRLAAFVVTRDSIEFADLGEMAPVDTAVAEYREAVDRRLMDVRGIRDVASTSSEPDTADAGQGINAYGRQIAARILDTILEKHPDMKTLMIVPDGSLLLVPIGVLPLPDGKYVMEQYNTRHLTSVKDLAPFEAPKTDRALCVGGVNYDTGAPGELAESATLAWRGGIGKCVEPDKTRWESLPGADSEAREVSAKLRRAGKKPESLTKERAGEEQVKRAMAGKSVIHLATHGYFVSCDTGENPLLLSGLVLAGANGGDKTGEAGDGYLTAEEVTALDLTGTQIVVLSACDAGLGRVERGEGVMGLRRAFMLAGAENVVMSLWKVPDRQTRELMNYFYDEWLKTGDAGGAMQAASLKTLAARRTAGLSENPLFWAAFISAGRP